jgi:putative ABC transport system permease protein
MSTKMNLLSLLLANLRGKPGRNFATAFCFAFIAANVFTAQYFIAGTSGSVDQGMSRMGADLLVAPYEYSLLFKESGQQNTVALVRVDPSRFRMSRSLMENFGKVDGIEKMSPQLYVTTMSIPTLASTPVMIFGFDPATDFTIQPWLDQPLDHPLGTGEILVGNAIPGAKNTRIMIADQSYTIAGRLDPTQSSIDNSVFLSLPEAHTLAGRPGVMTEGAPSVSPAEISAVFVKVKAGSDPAVVGAQIKRPTSDISYITRHFTLNPVSEDVKGIPGLLGAISTIVVIASLPLVALIAAMVAHERQREIGLLKSMGAKRSTVFLIVIGESLALSALGGIAGILMSLGLFVLINPQSLLGDTLQVSFQMPSITSIGLMAGTAFFVVMIIGSIASLWPAYRSCLLNPYDAIRCEG